MSMLAFKEELGLNIGQELAVHRRTEEETVLVSEFRSFVANEFGIKFSCFFYSFNAEGFDKFGAFFFYGVKRAGDYYEVVKIRESYDTTHDYGFLEESL